MPLVVLLLQNGWFLMRTIDYAKRRGLNLNPLITLVAVTLSCGCSAARSASPVPQAPSIEASPAPGHPAINDRVVLDSGGWVLVGDFIATAAEHPIPAALLLHQAAGSRREHEGLARALAERGIASLRLDLRACGDSINLGRFEEPYAQHRFLLEGTHDDVNTALQWLQDHAAIDGKRIAVVGASYSGEAVGEALRSGGPKAAAYVMLSPGSFSDDSIALVDASRAAWMFVRTIEESPVSLPFIDSVFDALSKSSNSAQLAVIRGAGHATHILEDHPEVVNHLADWIARELTRPTSQ